MKTNQEIFNQVADHLMKQGRKSLLMTDNYTALCAYRGADGASCAVGCLISDDFYSEELEGGGIMAAVQVALHNSGVPIIDDTFLSLLCQLQNVHDKCEPSRWADDLHVVAMKFGLELPASVLANLGEGNAGELS